MKLLPALAAAVLLPGTAFAADWIKAESPNFVVYSDVSGDVVKRHVETLELFDAVLHMKLGAKSDAPAPRKLPIYLVSKQRSLKKARPGASESLAGFYSASRDDIFAIAVFERHDMSVLLHEYTHHFMLAKFPYGYPSWLVEGYAEYFMTFEQKGNLLSVGDYNRNRASWLQHETWLPYEEVLAARPHQMRRGEDVAMYYAQSWALTHYMVSDPGRNRQLSAYLQKIGSGGDPVKSMSEATGLSMSELGKSVRRHMMSLPYQTIKVSDLRLPPVTVAKLPASADDVLLLTLRVMSDSGVDGDEDETDGPVLLADARAAAAKHPGDRLAELLLARAEAKLGDRAIADRLLRGRLEADPQDAEALQLLAEIRLQAADDAADAKTADALRAEARSFAGRAYRSDPNRYQVLLAYGEGRRSVAGFPTDNDLKVYIDALDLAPQVADVRVQAAQVLALHDRYADAAAVLRPVVYDPHAGAGLEPVRRLLAAYEAKAAATSGAATGE
jgi:hypothetical protein